MKGANDMDIQTLYQMVEEYRRIFTFFEIEKLSFPKEEKVIAQEVILPYCYKLLDTVEELLHEERIEEARHHIGFIKGCLWSQGWVSIKELEHIDRHR